jgi:hypothetical protein
VSKMPTMVRWVTDRIPANLAVFIAAIFLSNSVNLFTTIYGSADIPPRYAALLFSCIASLLAAALWTALAAKTDLIEKTVASASPDFNKRESIRESIWNDLWIRMSIYLSAAVISSLSALFALVIRG